MTDPWFGETRDAFLGFFYFWMGITAFLLIVCSRWIVFGKRPKPPPKGMLMKLVEKPNTKLEEIAQFSKVRRKLRIVKRPRTLKDMP